MINALNKYTVSATSLYGIYTGGVETVIGLPVAICYGLAVAALPNVSTSIAKGEVDLANKKIGYSLVATMLLSASAAIFIYFSSGFVVKTLFGGLSAGEREVMRELMKFSSINIVFLSLVQTETSCLIALGKNFVPCIFLGSGLLVKVILQPILLSNPKINIFAPLISDISCYFVAVFGNLVYIIIYSGLKDKGNEDEDNFGGDRRKSGRYDACGS